MSFIFKAIGSILVGAVGGWLFGFIILSFGFFIGKGGDKGIGQEHFGYWQPREMFGLAGFYGIPLGAIMYSVGYLIFLRNVPPFKALAFSVIGTLFGGLSGALIGPPVAALGGVAGFFVAAFIASHRYDQ